jgi:hypothetical protein
VEYCPRKLHSLAAARASHVLCLTHLIIPGSHARPAAVYCMQNLANLAASRRRSEFVWRRQDVRLKWVFFSTFLGGHSRAPHHGRAEAYRQAFGQDPGHNRRGADEGIAGLGNPSCSLAILDHLAASSFATLRTAANRNGIARQNAAHIPAMPMLPAINRRIG